MINVTVKTLDSQNHVFNVEEDISVKQFKESISPTINIPVDQQRLIFRGRVLQDDKKLNEYNVANNVVHVVQRPSNQNNTANDEPRPSNPAGHPEDGLGGGRNAIIMGAIGLPSFGVEGDGNEDGGMPTPRRSGATIRLMVGNQLLNRASVLLQQLEDGGAPSASANIAPSSSSSATATVDEEVVVEPAELGNANNVDIMDMDIDFEDDDADPGSLERMISQVVNVSSAAALVAAIRQVNPGSSPATTTTTSSSGAGGIPPMTNSGIAASTATPQPPANNVPGSVRSASGPASVVSNPPSSAQTGASSTASPARRPENPRLRELATALQDLLALQDRLNPYLRFLQDALRQNRLYTELGETQSTQFLYNTISNILHLLSHSLHAFSDITCDFSLPPNDRRLTASSSILVEQSTVVRATIPVAVPAMLAQAANTTSNNNNVPPSGQAQFIPTTGNSTNAHQQQLPPNQLQSTPLSLYGGRFPGLSISIGGPRPGPVGGTIPYPITIPMSVNTQPGIASTQPWRNPNLQRAPAPTQGQQTQQQTGQAAPPQQQQLNNGMGMNFGNAMVGGVLNAQQLASLLPPGLQNFGALLGMPTPNGVQIVGGLNPQAGLIPPQPHQASGNNNSAPQSASTSSPSVTNPSTATATSTSVGQNPLLSGLAPNGVANGNAVADNNHGAGMFQNMLRNELTRSQFDPLLPCHTHHGNNQSRNSRSNRSASNNPPPEFRRFFNVEHGSSSGESMVNSEEIIEVLIDLINNSRLLEMLQPLVRDVVLNYLMRGRDSKNEAHVKTCAKGLSKKILPFFEKFSSKAGGKNENVDISATYLNILTNFIVSMMQKVTGQSQSETQFKSDVLNGLNDFQKQLIQALKICHPNASNVGLLFVNNVVEHFIGGMSITFKTRVRRRLVDHLKQLESDSNDASSSCIVYKQATSEIPVPSQPVPSTSSGSSVDAFSSPKKLATASTAITDDVDIDEVLQLPASMSSHADTPQQPNARGSGPSASQGHTCQTDGGSVLAVIRSLPSEWSSTIEQDIVRQVEMPAQPSFSPGYNTLFPRKH